MASVEFVYCDSCFFLAYFKEEEGRVDTVAQCFEEVKRNQNRKMVTSMISVTEVAHVAAGKSKTDKEQDVLMVLDDLWGNSSLVEVVEFNFSLARRARGLVRGFRGLKPADAIHLATAQLMSVPEFFYLR